MTKKHNPGSTANRTRKGPVGATGPFFFGRKTGLRAMRGCDQPSMFTVVSQVWSTKILMVPSGAWSIASMRPWISS